MKPWLRTTLIVLLALALIVGVGPFLVPVRPLTDTVPVAQLADADSRFADLLGLRVHFKLAGEGEPAVIMLHGFASSAYSWRQVQAPLATAATVVAFDRPAFGLTSRPLPGEWQGVNPYSPEGQVALALALMDELGLERAVLVGHSAGGAIAMRVALVHPERVSGLVLVAAAIYEGGTPAWLRPVLRTPQVRRLGPLISRSISKLGDRFLGSAWADPTRVSEETLALYRKPLRAENWDRALWEFTLASTGGDLAGREVELRMPVLVMTGDQDRIVPPASSQRLADALGVPLVTVADCGHLPQEEQPARFLDAVRPFLAELP